MNEWFVFFYFWLRKMLVYWESLELVLELSVDITSTSSWFASLWFLQKSKIKPWMWHSFCRQRFENTLYQVVHWLHLNFCPWSCAIHPIASMQIDSVMPAEHLLTTRQEEYWIPYKIVKIFKRTSNYWFEIACSCILTLRTMTIYIR